MLAGQGGVPGLGLGLGIILLFMGQIVLVGPWVLLCSLRGAKKKSGGEVMAPTTISTGGLCVVLILWGSIFRRLRRGFRSAALEGFRWWRSVLRGYLLV